jgi:hypothetical protein
MQQMSELEDSFSSVKDRAKKKLERDMGPLLMTALNDPRRLGARRDFPDADY